MLRNIGILTAATGLLWIAAAAPAFWMAGPIGLLGMTLAAVLCLLPGWLVFFLSSRYCVGRNQALVILLGTTLRLLFVLLGAIILTSVREDFRFREFLVWLVVFYLATLAIETWLVLKRMTE